MQGQVTTESGQEIRWTATAPSHGGSGRTLVFIHGLTLTADEWHAQVAALAGDYRIVTFDQRGHGDSSDWQSANQSIADSLAADLAELLEQLDLTDVVLVGHSLGGIAALQFLCDYPDIRDARVDGAVLISTTGTLRFLTESSIADACRTRLPLRRLESAVLRSVPKRLPWLIRQMKRRTGLEGCTQNTLDRVFCALAEYHLHERITDVPTPVSVICGTKDKVTPPFLSRRIAELMPRAQLHLVDEAGHGIVDERPTDITHQVDTFAGSLAA